MLADAPWIQRAEREGCDYMYEWLYGRDGEDEYEDEEDDNDELYFDCDREDLEVGFNPYTGSYDFDC